MAGQTDHDYLLKLVRQSKLYGRGDQLDAHIKRLAADPRGEIDKFYRRSKSAKASAKRRKKAARLAARAGN